MQNLATDSLRSAEESPTKSDHFHFFKHSNKTHKIMMECSLTFGWLFSLHFQSYENMLAGATIHTNFCYVTLCLQPQKTEFLIYLRI